MWTPMEVSAQGWLVISVITLLLGIAIGYDWGRLDGYRRGMNDQKELDETQIADFVTKQQDHTTASAAHFHDGLL